MKKEYLDFLYEQRSETQSIIDALVEKDKLPTTQCCKNMHLDRTIKQELKARREQILGINKSIEKYLKLHN